MVIKIGKVVNTHGLKGEVRILSDFKYKDIVFEIGNHLYINNEALVIASYRVHKNYDMVTFDGINSIDEVLKYKGKNVYIDRNDYVFPDYLNEDLIGTDVYGNGELLGTLAAIEHNNKQELLVIDNGTTKFLVPFVPEFIKSLSLEKIEINLIKGLVDEN